MTDSADIARTRQGLYRFLGGALSSPDARHLDMLASAAQVLDSRDVDMFAFSPTWRTLTRHFPSDTTNDRLEVEYVRLFASGMSGALSPPTESYYRVPAKGGGIAQFVADLQMEYRSMGLTSVGLSEAPDHVSTELEVMAFLCDQEASEWAADRAQSAADLLGYESRFLKRHLTVWIPLFRDRVHAARASQYYIDLVEVLHSFVVQDRDYVDLIRGGMSV